MSVNIFLRGLHGSDVWLEDPTLAGSTGTSASGFKFSQLANGTAAYGASSFGWAQAATGAEYIAGTSASGFKFSDGAAGSEIVSGTSAVDFKLSGEATGAETFASTAASSFPYSTAAGPGVQTFLGPAAQAFKASTVATGLETLTGTTGSAWRWTPAGTGAELEAGTGGSSWTWAQAGVVSVANPVTGTSASGWKFSPAGVVSVANPVTGTTHRPKTIALVFPGPAIRVALDTNLLAGPFPVVPGQTLTVHLTALNSGNIGIFAGGTPDSPSQNSYQPGTVGDHTFTPAYSPVWVYSFPYTSGKTGSGTVDYTEPGTTFPWFNIPGDVNGARGGTVGLTGAGGNTAFKWAPTGEGGNFDNAGPVHSSFGWAHSAATGSSILATMSGEAHQAFKWTPASAGTEAIGSGTSGSGWRWHPSAAAIETIYGTAATGGGWNAHLATTIWTLEQKAERDDRILDAYWPHRRAPLRR